MNNTPEQIKYSNKMRDDIIRILEDCPDMAAVYPLLHYMESEIKQVEDFWENAHASTEEKLKGEIYELKGTIEEAKDLLNHFLFGDHMRHEAIQWVQEVEKKTIGE